MPFESDDCYVGMIVYYTVNDLRKQRDIVTTARTFDKKSRPFVCYAAANELTYWTCFTRTFKPWRRTVSRRWLRFPDHPFTRSMSTSDLIISEGHDSFVGPAQTFARLSIKHDVFPGLWRPMLLPEGVDEVRSIVRARRGLLPKPVKRMREPQESLVAA